MWMDLAWHRVAHTTLVPYTEPKKLPYLQSTLDESEVSPLRFKLQNKNRADYYGRRVGKPRAKTLNAKSTKSELLKVIVSSRASLFSTSCYRCSVKLREAKRFWQKWDQKKEERNVREKKESSRGANFTEPQRAGEIWTCWGAYSLRETASREPTGQVHPAAPAARWAGLAPSPDGHTRATLKFVHVVLLDWNFLTWNIILEEHGSRGQ